MRDDDPVRAPSVRRYLSRSTRFRGQASTSEDATTKRGEMVNDSAPRRGHVATRIDDACALLAEVSARRREDVVDAYDSRTRTWGIGARHCERGAAGVLVENIRRARRRREARATVLAFIEYVDDDRRAIHHRGRVVAGETLRAVRVEQRLVHGGGVADALDGFAESARKRGVERGVERRWTSRASTGRRDRRGDAVSMAFDGMMIASASARSGIANVEASNRRRWTRTTIASTSTGSRKNLGGSRGTRAQARVLTGGRSRRRAVSSTASSSPRLLSLFARAVLYTTNNSETVSPGRARHALRSRVARLCRSRRRSFGARLWDKSRSPT